MGKLKSFFICIASLCCPVLICTSSAAGEVLRTAAYFSAGALPESAFHGNVFNSTDSESNSQTASNYSYPSSEPTVSHNHDNSNISETQSAANSLESTNSDAAANSSPATLARVIEKNRTQYVDDTDFSKYAEQNGKIYRYAYKKSTAGDYINLPSGAQVRNVTEKPNSLLEAASKELPDIQISDPTEPTVLIYHTHTTESFMPEGDTYNKDYPNRSRDDSRNMTAVGDALCKALAENGVTAVHDCTVHDYPSYTGSYKLSAQTIKRNLEEYPSIKIIIDIHRDGITNADGSLVAPVVEINGKSAAQFMIVSGCECSSFSIPHYLENFKLGCLLQNTAESKYPNLARGLLFDYREYNQGIKPGTLLIEVGSHGNSLNEVVYTGELLGEIIAEAAKQLTVDN